jgi:hypothetical protein
MISYLAEYCTRVAASAELQSDEHVQRRAVCAWGMAAMIFIMDSSPRFMSPGQVLDFTNAWQAFAVTYQALAAEAQRQHRCLYKFRPKLHDLCHIALLVQKFGINPRHRSCFGEEDLMGKVARTARKTHRSSINLSFLRRHMLRVCVRWNERAQSSGWQVS